MKIGEISESEGFEPLGPSFSIPVQWATGRWSRDPHIVCKCKECGTVTCRRKTDYNRQLHCGCQPMKQIDKRDKYDNHTIRRMVEFKKQGKTASEIGQILGCSHKTVIKKLTRLGYDCSRRYSGKDNARWSGYKEIPKTYWNQIRNGALKRDYEFSITIEQAWDQFLRQERKCALSGEEIEFQPPKNKEWQTASLDRIDSRRGYTVDNIQWVHKIVNKMKVDLQEAEFIYMAHQIARHNPIPEE